MDNADIDRRLARVESHIGDIDKAIDDIREEQEAARTRDTERQVSMGKLTTQLEGLIAALATHNKWHDDHKQSAFNIANISVSVCALGVLVLELIKKVS